MKTIIITGSRHYINAKLIKEVMSNLIEEFGVYKFRHGGANGADTLGKSRAIKLGVTDIIEYKADWDTHGKAAGPIRNREMLDTEIEKGEDILVIAFPLANSIGTFDMIEYSRGKGIDVRIYN